jgi:hypothetical protein
MIFTNSRSQSSYTGNLIKHYHNRNINPSSVFSIISPTRYIPSNTITIQNTPEIEQTKPKTMKWGEPIWFLFHSLAEKVKENAFSSIREELLNVIYTICSNLPCPDCANHAVIYLNSIHYKTIQTKDQLKNMLFIFHNTINQKKNYAIFPRDQLDTKYKNVGLIPIIHNFMKHFKDKHKSIHMIANDLHRARIVNQLKTWFNSNIQSFDL